MVTQPAAPSLQATPAHSRASRIAWSVFAVNAVLWGLFAYLWGLRGFAPLPGSLLQDSQYWLVVRAIQGVAFMTSAAIGALVATRHPKNPIGWLIILTSTCAAIEFPVFEYGALATYVRWLDGPPPGVVPVAWSVIWISALNSALDVPLLLLFPDGRVPSARWRFLLWGTALLVLMLGIGAALRPGALDYAPGFANPFGLPQGAEVRTQMSQLVILWGLPVVNLLAAASLVVRFQQAHSERRQQLKWVVYAAVLYWLIIAATLNAPTAWLPYVDVVYVLAHAAFVLALGLAILRYRLYDIDVVISKTLVYGTLAVAITAAYIIVVVGIGALIGTRGEPNVWLSLLATAVVAVAFEPLRERVQRLANQLVYGYRASPYEVLTGFSQRVAEALTPDELLPRMVEAAAHGVGAQAGRVRVYAPGGQDRTVTWPANADGEPFTHVVPVLHQGNRVGEIAVRKPPGDVLTATEEALLADLAAQAGLALGNLRLSLELEGRLRAEAEQRARELEVLYSADEALYRTPRVDDVLRSLVDVGADLLRADKAHVMVWDERHEKLIVGAARGFHSATLAELTYAPHESLTGQVALTGEVVAVDDVLTDPRVARRITDREGIRSMMRVPLTVEGQVFGVFGVSYCRPHRFSTEEKRLLVALGRRAALAIENAHLYEQAQQAATVAERKRLARELHDSVTQSLFSATLLAEAGRHFATAGNLGAVTEYLTQLGETAQQALKEMRLLVYELRPLALEHDGLVGALQHRLDAVERRAGTQARLLVEGDLDLPGAMEAGLFGIAQEALNNALKHAHARNVTVRIAAGSGQVMLEIRDDGCGFQPEAAAETGGLGLVSMHERAERLGASLTVNTSPGTGTTITVCLNQAGSTTGTELETDIASTITPGTV